MRATYDLIRHYAPSSSAHARDVVVALTEAGYQELIREERLPSIQSGNVLKSFGISNCVVRVINSNLPARIEIEGGERDVNATKDSLQRLLTPGGFKFK